MATKTYRLETSETFYNRISIMLEKHGFYPNDLLSKCQSFLSVRIQEYLNDVTGYVHENSFELRITSNHSTMKIYFVYANDVYPSWNNYFTLWTYKCTNISTVDDFLKSVGPILAYIEAMQPFIWLGAFTMEHYQKPLISILKAESMDCSPRAIAYMIFETIKHKVYLEDISLQDHPKASKPYPVRYMFQDKKDCSLVIKQDDVLM